jgi:hypothetical protein
MEGSEVANIQVTNFCDLKLIFRHPWSDIQRNKNQILYSGIPHVQVLG